MVGYFLVIVPWLLVISLTGCARTVTSIVTYGTQMSVTVTLRGDADITTSRYFLVVGSNASYKVPLPTPDMIDLAPEMLEPGSLPFIGSAESYQVLFYNTWAGYVVIDQNGFSLTKGPYLYTTTPTRESLANPSQASNQLTFAFRLDQLFNSIPDKIYFDVIAVNWPNSSAKMPIDHLPSINNYIATIEGSSVSVDDLGDEFLAASQDIINCRVEIQ